MIEFSKPVNFNGAELVSELEQSGISINDRPLIDGNGNLWLDIDEKDKLKVEDILKNHNGTIIPPEPTLETKLASVGISLPELKAALN